jgi:hypothetical protein
MARSSYLRIAGVALIVGALLSVFTHALYGATFLIIGLVGFYAAHKNVRGFWLLLGTVLKILTIISLIILEVLSLIYRISSVDQLSPLHGVVLLITFFADLLADFILGVSIIRLGVFPKLAGALLLLSTVLCLIHSCGKYPYYGCLVWIGYLLVRGLKDQNISSELPGKV